VMRIHRLEVSNFRVIREARLDLGDRVIGIIGPNGAGKSSLVEAIAWALYGNAVARSGKDEIKSDFARPEQDCSVSLTFSVDGELYTMERRLVGARQRPEARLMRDGRLEASGATETTARAAQILGLEWRGFLTSFLARQQELNALADLPPGQRRDHLAGMLGIERLDQAIQRLKVARKDLDQKTGHLDEQAARLGELEELLRGQAEHVATLADAERGNEGARAAAEEAFRAAEARSREHARLQAECSRLRGQRETAAAAKTQLEEQLTELLRRQKELEAGKVRLVELSREIADLDSIRARLTQLSEARQRLQLVQTLQVQLTRAKSEIGDLVERQGCLDKEIAACTKALAELPADIDELVTAGRAELERVRTVYTETREKLKVVETDSARARDQVKSMAEIGPDAVCDRCLRPFGDDLPKIKSHLQFELTELNRRRAALQADLDSQASEEQRLKEQLLQRERQAAEHREGKVKKEALDRQQSDLRSRSEQAQQQADNLGEQLQNIGDTAFDPAEFDTVSRRVDQLQRLQSEALKIQGRVTDLADVTRSAETVKKKLDVAAEEVSQAEAALAELGYDETVFRSLQEDFERRQSDFESARQAHTQAATELQLAQRELAVRREEAERLEPVRRQVEECRNDLFYTEKLSQLFGDFRKVMIAGIRPRLARLASQLITEMSGGRYSLVELDPDYNLQVMDYGQYYGIERFSGGEKDLASLCLRLAISLALTESAGLTRSFVILDEVFGSQDSGRRELIFQALANLKNRFPQMILITHLDELKHKVETLVEVTPTPAGWSEVRVDGGVV